MNPAEIAISFFLLGLSVGGCLGKKSLDAAVRSRESHARILAASIQECRTEIERLRAEPGRCEANARLQAASPPPSLYQAVIATHGAVRFWSQPMGRN